MQSDGKACAVVVVIVSLAQTPLGPVLDLEVMQERVRELTTHVPVRCAWPRVEGLHGTADVP